MKKNNSKIVYLVASGDLRLSANRACEAAQAAMEKQIAAAVAREGYRIQRAHPFDPVKRHGFIDSQKRGMEVFRGIPADEPLIVAEAVWQYSHHVLPGLTTHRGPILTVANWSGEWPGLVGMLNINGCLTKAGVKFSTLWSENFTDEFFLSGLRRWLKTGAVRHDTSHVRRFVTAKAPAGAVAAGVKFACELRGAKAIMGLYGDVQRDYPGRTASRDRRVQGTSQPVGALRENVDGVRRRRAGGVQLARRARHEVPTR